MYKRQLEANTPQPAAAAAETVKETAPVAVTPQTEAVAETSAEEKTPKKRGVSICIKSILNH